MIANPTVTSAAATTMIKNDMPINYYIFLSIALFSIGIVGVLTRRNAIIIFMCVELMLNAVNLMLVAFSKMHYKAALLAGDVNGTAGTDGQLFVFFIMVVAAAEVTVMMETLQQQMDAPPLVALKKDGYVTIHLETRLNQFAMNIVVMELLMLMNNVMMETLQQQMDAPPLGTRTG